MRYLSLALSLSILSLNLTIAQERGPAKGGEVLTPIKRSDVELLNPIADGTPRPPKPPIVVTPPGKVQRSTVYVMKDHTMTMTRIRPSDAVVLQKPEPKPKAPSREPTKAEIERWEEMMKHHTTFSLSATVYDNEVSFLSWWHEKKRYSCWSNVPFTHIAGLGSYNVRGHHYSLFMGIGVERTEYQHIDPDQWPGLPPEMPEWPPQFEMVSEEPEGKAGLAPIIALHELYAIEHKKLAKAYEGRERYWKERQEWLKENPPKPQSTMVYYWPNKGGDVREELPPPAAGIVKGRKNGIDRSYRRASQAKIPTDAKELAALQAQAEKEAREADVHERFGNDRPNQGTPDLKK